MGLAAKAATNREDEDEDVGTKQTISGQSESLQCLLAFARAGALEVPPDQSVARQRQGLAKRKKQLLKLEITP